MLYVLVAQVKDAAELIEEERAKVDAKTPINEEVSWAHSDLTAALFGVWRAVRTCAGHAPQCLLRRRALVSGGGSGRRVGLALLVQFTPQLMLPQPGQAPPLGP